MPRVLVVSKTDLSVDLGRTVLWRSDVERAFASDEPTACAAARAWGPNLVVFDGQERDEVVRAVARLREDPATRRTAIAIVSRAPLLADADALRKTGANAVLPPAVDPAVWDARLEELLSVPPRKDVRIPVEVGSWSPGDRAVREGRALNISVKGLLLEAPDALEVGQKLDLRFRLPGSDQDVEAIAEVVWRDDRPRTGVKFLVLPGAARAAIASFVEAGSAPWEAAPAARGQDEWSAAVRAADILKTAILESSPDAMVVLTHEGRIVALNRAVEHVTACSRGELLGGTLLERIVGSESDLNRQALVFGLATGATALVERPLELRLRRGDGREIPVEMTIAATPMEGQPLYMALLRDLTETKRAQRIAAATRQITDASAAAEGLPDLCAAIHRIASGLVEAGGLSIALRDETSGSLGFAYLAADPASGGAESAGPKALSDDVLRTGEPRHESGWLGLPLETHGQAFGVLAVRSPDPAVPFADEDRALLTLVSPGIAVALERKQAEARIQYLAYQDALTGLANRHLLLDRLQLGLAQAARDRNHLAVLAVDLDRFKVINDSLGHFAGDQVLKEAAARLERFVRKGDTLARVGGDTFTVVVRALRDPADAGKVAEKLQHSLAEPIQVGDRELFVTACIGISIFPDDGADVDALLKNADTALHRAKEGGQGAFRLYDPSMNAEAVQRLRVEHGLRRAVMRDEFVIYYQPVVDLATGRIHSVEALTRWRHPERGVLLPAEFMAVAEATGVIRSIGSWGLKTACAQTRAWQQEGHPHLSVAVNLSAKQLQQMNVVAEVTGALEASGLPPAFLELEITETSAMVDPQATIRALKALKAVGVRISIDDFGIGYSSLSQLQRLPIDALKIDQSFVRDVTTDPDDAAIVKAIISLGHTLKLGVVAEGVETPEQLAFLAGQGCDRIQGYVFGHPVPPDECAAVLRAHQPHVWRHRQG